MTTTRKSEGSPRPRFPTPSLDLARTNEKASAADAAPWAPSPFHYSPGNPLALLLFLLPYLWVFRITILAERKGDFSQIGSYQLLQIAIVILACVAVAVSARAPKMWQISRGRPAVMLLYYYFFCLIISVFSALPQFSAYRSIEYISIMSAIFLALSYRKNFIDAEKAMIAFVVLILITNVMGRGVLFGFSFSWSHWHTNDYPAGGGMLLCYCVGEFFGNRQGNRFRLLLGALAGAACLLLGTSTGSFLAVAAGFVVIAYFRRSVPLFLIGGLSAALLMLLSIAGVFETEAILDVVAMGKNERDFETASGRLPIWEYYFENYVSRKPIFGNGLGTLSDEVAGVLVKAQPHASFMSVLLYTGAVGMAMYLWFVLRCVRDGFWACGHRLPGAVGCVSAIAVGFVNSQTNPFIFDIFEATSAVFCAILAVFTLFVVVPGRQAASTEAPRPTSGLLTAKAKPDAHHLRRPLLP